MFKKTAQLARDGFPYYFMTSSPLIAPSRVPEVISAPSILDYSNSTLPGVTIFIWSRKQFCLAGTESAKYKVAVLVLSAPKNREKRQNIRKLQLPGCHLQVFSNRSIKQMGDNFTITAWKCFVLVDLCLFSFCSLLVRLVTPASRKSSTRFW